LTLSNTLTPPADVYGWDWTATTHEAPEDELPALVRRSLEALGGAHTLPTKGINGWAKGAQTFDCDGYALGTVYFGGRDDVYVVATSAAADIVRTDVLSAVPGKTSRVDTRVDTLVPFEDLSRILEDAADTYGSLITEVSSRSRGVSKGRTVYLGAPSSAIRVRLYEKWLESPDQYVEGTNRLEVQLRPPSAVKRDVSAWSRAQTFCASKTTAHLAVELGNDLAEPQTLHVKRDTPTLEQTLASMGKQYRRGVSRWLEVSGGDVSRVLEHLDVLDSAHAHDDERPSVPIVSRARQQ
jgi:hypothetical protein